MNKNLDDVINKLIKYTTEMPKQQEGYDRCHRLPYISSEMLAIDSEMFYRAFFGEDVAKNCRENGGGLGNNNQSRSINL